MNNIYVDKLQKSCENCPFYKLDTYTDINYVTRSSYECVLEGSILTGDCPLKPLSDRLAEERKKVVGELKVDIRSLFNSYASSLIDYCIWNKNADNNQKLYNNFKRIVNDRLVKVLDLFDKRIDQIERGE